MRGSQHDRLQALLAQAKGRLVTSAQIEAHLGIGPRTGGARIHALRAARPHLIIENVPRQGFRLVDKPTPPEPETEKPLRPPPPAASRLNTAATPPLPEGIAADVMRIATESGELLEEAMERLLWYGIAVHNDLVAGGENPLGLRSINTRARVVRA